MQAKITVFLKITFPGNLNNKNNIHTYSLQKVIYFSFIF